MIEKQIKQNIERYGKCWFFLDSEFLRYLTSHVSKANRLNLDWIIAFLQKDLLATFAINYNGEIRRIYIDDFESIRTSTNRDKFKNNEISILSNVLYGYGYTNNEIRSLVRNKGLSQDKGALINWLKKKDQDERAKKLGYILQIMSGSLEDVDFLFGRESFDWGRASFAATKLGILRYEDKLWSMEDYYDINNYFPSYVKNKLFWDEIAHRRFPTDKFKFMVKGTHNERYL
jgi:hypothetical protein